MKEAMQKWLSRRQIAFNPDEAKLLCDKLGLKGEEQDSCYMLVADLEANRINGAEFTIGLATLTDKKPEEVMGVLRGMSGSLMGKHKEPVPQFLIVYHGTDSWESAQSIVNTGIFKGEAGRDTFTDAIGEKPYFKYNLRLRIAREYIEEVKVPSPYYLAPGITNVYAPTKDEIPVEAEMVGVLRGVAPATPEVIKEVIEEGFMLATEFINKLPVKLVKWGIGGSIARGTPRVDSDIDVYVLFRRDEDIPSYTEEELGRIDFHSFAEDWEVYKRDPKLLEEWGRGLVTSVREVPVTLEERLR